MSEISIIIPVYNSDEYLAETIASVLKQDFTDFEIICLYCPSKDESLQTLNSFANRDERIKIIHRPNEFAGQSRNYGIQNAGGKYIVFVDSDDILPSNSLSLMHDAALNTEADMICFNAREYENELPGRLLIDYSQISTGCRLLKTEDFFVVPNFSWARLYNADFLREHLIKFSDSKFAEDVAFCVKAYVEAKSVFLFDTVVYYYRKTGKSATSKFESCYPDLLKEYMNALTVVSKSGNEQTLWSFSQCLVHTYIYFYRHHLTSQASKSDFFLQMKAAFGQLNPSFFSDFYTKEFFSVKKAKDYLQFDKIIKWNFLFKFSIFGIPILSAKRADNITKFYLFTIIPVAKLKI